MATIKPTRVMMKRIRAIMFVLVIATLSITAFRLAKIMIVDSEFYQTKAAEQQLYDTEITAERGNIYDSNMNLLATSATVWTVYVSPNDIKSVKDDTRREEIKRTISSGLAQILEMEEEKIHEYTNKSSSYVRVKKNIEKAGADAVRKFVSEEKLGRYVGLDESTKRYYPNGNLASVVLGFAGDDNQGLSGLEAYYDEQLTGTSGRVVAAKKANGDTMPFSYEKVVDASQGNSLVLTLDSYVQYVCEKHLEQAIIDNACNDRGACVVMNVNSGEILGMAVKGDFDPNSPFDLSEKETAEVEAIENKEERSELLKTYRNRQWRNKAVSDTYEPGSVFKIVTCSAALEENAAKTSNTYNCPGYIVVAGRRYNCHKKIGHGVQNLVESMGNSCNPVFITLGQKLGVSTFKAFGFTEKTGIDLPGEASSVYHSESSMGATELASSAFGQTFKITPMQMITAVSAAVNGGKLVKPHVVKTILNSNNDVVSTVGSQVKRQVVSAETSKTICEILEFVVEQGGGKNAAVPGYKIGAKTGTSEKVADALQQGVDALYIGSTIGIAPMNSPEIAVLVMLDEPTGSAYYGGTIAAPVVSQVLAEILPYLGFEPDYTQEELASISVAVPNVTDKKVDVAKATIMNSGLKCKIVGGGSTVISQSPKPSQQVQKGGTVVLYTEGNQAENKVTVPNLVGKTLSQVNSEAANSGINIAYSGSYLTDAGVISYKQSVEPGTQVAAGTSVTVYFRSTDTADR
ncbi:MAG: penicillin-binding transpeptidase domain-containing protein [bacterium]|nr:penicillin-binding transpeptidase domain-containing protein [bacterium]